MSLVRTRDSVAEQASRGLIYRATMPVANAPVTAARRTCPSDGVRMYTSNQRDDMFVMCSQDTGTLSFHDAIIAKYFSLVSPDTSYTI